MLYRAPYSDRWEHAARSIGPWTGSRSASSRRATPTSSKSATGSTLNHLTTIASLGGATLDNEENYLIKKLFNGGLGILPIENQARI